MLTGFDAPPLHTLYLDRPLKGALLMQTLARVNRTFRRQARRPARRLRAAGGEPGEGARRVHRERPGEEARRPGHRRGRRAQTRRWSSQLDALCAGFDWRAKLAHDPAGLVQGRDRRSPITCARPRLRATRSPTATTPSSAASGSWRANSPGRGRWRRAARHSPTSGRQCSSTRRSASTWPSSTPPSGRPRGEPVPEEIQRCSPTLVATSTMTGRILDIYEAAGIPKPSLSDLSPDFAAQAQRAENPHLASRRCGT